VAFFLRPPVSRRPDGSFDVLFDEDERDMLRHLLEQLRDLLLSDDPLLRRLFPPAYLDDPDRDRDYQTLMRGDLIESRFAAIETVETTLTQTRLDEPAMHRWMQSVNALRLVLGTRLDVSEDGDPPERDDPDFPLWVAYKTLDWMLVHIVEALSDTLPPEGVGDDDTAPEL
jgi:hypothetical protein